MSQSPIISFPEHLRRLAVHYASKVAAQDDLGSLTYGELGEAMEAVAAALVAAGVKKGDRVATAMQPSLAHMVVILGCLARGAIPCPLNTRLTASEFAAYLEPIAPALIIADADNAPAVRGLATPMIELAAANRAGGLSARLVEVWAAKGPVELIAPEDIALIMPTGGTTGTPKGAYYTHGALCLFLGACAWNEGRLTRDTELYFSPFFHVSIVTGWMCTLYVGGSVQLIGAFSAPASLKAIAGGATFLMGAATMFQTLRQHPDFASTDRSKIRFLSVGAMAATPELIDTLLADFPNAQLRHGYGATEYGPVTYIPHEALIAGRRSGVGLVQLGCKFTVVDEALQPLPVGEIGELVVDCSWRASGYWGRPAETAETFTALGVRLGDLGFLDAGGWVTIAGRRKEMIISGGENIFPNEVEAVLSKHPAVREICVYGAKHDHSGERVEAAVVVALGADLSLEQLVAFGREHLGGYKLPKRLRVLETLPLTPNNKPDRRRLTAEAQA